MGNLWTFPCLAWAVDKQTKIQSYWGECLGPPLILSWWNARWQSISFHTFQKVSPFSYKEWNSGSLNRTVCKCIIEKPNRKKEWQGWFHTAWGIVLINFLMRWKLNSENFFHLISYPTLPQIKPCLCFFIACVCAHVCNFTWMCV